MEGATGSHHYMNPDSRVCQVCGQFHEQHGPHLYDYHESVDEDLVCHICLQPLVSPLDTKCGHTFCGRCIKNYLSMNDACPVDRSPLSSSQLMLATHMVRRLLDKLLVVCPNVDYCEAVLPRCELESHLQHRCHGAVVACVRSKLGCRYQGPRGALQNHLWECQYRNLKQGICHLPLDGDLSTVEFSCPLGACPGLTIVGGIDTPLMCIVIQDVIPGGLAFKDGRLRPGDQILQVNGEDLTEATHEEARQALSHMHKVGRFTVFRERITDRQILDEQEELFKVTLPKENGRQLGIKLVGKRYEPGIYILDVIEGGAAYQNGTLQPDDRVLEVNGYDARAATQEETAQVIQASRSKVEILISRKTRSQTPDLIRLAPNDNVAKLVQNIKSIMADRVCRERVITVHKDANETLGMSVAGGVGAQRGNTPIYISNIYHKGCLGRTGHIQKGDVLLSINSTNLVGLTHAEAVTVLKASAESKVISLKIIEGSETTDGMKNFVPSWTFWLSLPKMCHLPRTITISKGHHSSLGFSIVGGADSCHGNQPIFVKAVVQGTQAAHDGRLKCGDQLLSVNGNSLQNLTHYEAVQILKDVRNSATLVVISWPGSLH